jgi:hypothetical protein
MQHLKVASERGDEALARRYIQITPITPGTSFNISSGDGTMSERALMLAVLAYDERLGRDFGRFERLGTLRLTSKAYFQNSPGQRYRVVYSPISKIVWALEPPDERVRW